MLRRFRTGVIVVSAAAGLTLLSACSGTTALPTPVPGGGTGGGQVGNAAAATETAVKLAATDVGELGKVLTDGDGQTLYRFDKDTAKPPKSACVDDCAKAWPPLLSKGDVQVDGVDKSLVGSVTRDDGTEQVTVNGWPLYTYAKDTTPGDATGQGVNGTWFAATPQGGKAGKSTSDGVNLSAGEVKGVGAAVVDQDGFTLYLFTKDSKKPSKSTCDGDCAKLWPPMLTSGDVALDGIDAKLLGSVKRADGTTQATLGGWPLYRYSKDTAPGQANGMGVKGTWFVIEPNGCKSGTTTSTGTAPAKPTTSAPAAGASSDPYSY
ncbi:SCO0930 family lipoprotein [Amycolatopsis sp. NPDC051373]|uniref:SCO0930 family lipoprotein n=1 Tax=Amycolatopsis sp. NPDC051373 TaxID=3155801 RepID=UPI00344DE41B